MFIKSVWMRSVHRNAEKKFLELKMGNLGFQQFTQKFEQIFEMPGK
jgi:hypothetical protein